MNSTISLDNIYKFSPYFPLLIGGACTTLGAFKSIAELKLPVNVVLGLSFVENKLGSDAYRTSDVIKSLKGLTVEIGNTDAEGRLILADTMTYV